MNIWKTKFKPNDKVRWKHNNQIGTVLTVEIQEPEEKIDDEKYLVTYELVLDGNKPTDPSSLKSIMERGLELVD